MPQPSLARIGELNLNYVVEGGGDWVVVIGGFATAYWQSWAKYMPALTQNLFREFCVKKDGDEAECGRVAELSAQRYLRKDADSVLGKLSKLIESEEGSKYVDLLREFLPLEAEGAAKHFADFGGYFRLRSGNELFRVAFVNRTEILLETGDNFFPHVRRRFCRRCDQNETGHFRWIGGGVGNRRGATHAVTHQHEALEFQLVDNC